MKTHFPDIPIRARSGTPNPVRHFSLETQLTQLEKKAEVERKSPFFLPDLLPLESHFLNKVKAKLGFFFYQLIGWLSLWPLVLADEIPTVVLFGNIR